MFSNHDRPAGLVPQVAVAVREDIRPTEPLGYPTALALNKTPPCSFESSK